MTQCVYLFYTKFSQVHTSTQCMFRSNSLHVCVSGKVHKCQNVHKYLPVLNACVCFMERFTNAKMFTISTNAQCMCVHLMSTVQMSKCSQISLPVLNARVWIWCLQYKGSQTSKCSQISLPVLNACVCFMERFTNAKITLTYKVSLSLPTPVYV